LDDFLAVWSKDFLREIIPVWILIFALYLRRPWVYSVPWQQVSVHNGVPGFDHTHCMTYGGGFVDFRGLQALSGPMTQILNRLQQFGEFEVHQQQIFSGLAMSIKLLFCLFVVVVFFCPTLSLTGRLNCVVFMT
jgi:hypothetical protein